MMEDLHKRVTVVETKVESLEKKSDEQKVKNDDLTRLIVLFENQEKRQEERDLKQQEQLDKFSETMINVNENLKGLNKGLETLDKRVGKLESNENERKLDLGLLFKDLIYKILPALIIAWLIYELGIK